MADTEPRIRVELVNYSMFADTPVYDNIEETIDGVKQKVVVFGLKRDVVVPDPTDIVFTVPQGGQHRLDLISQKFYGTPELWWAISRCNPSIDPLVGPLAGDNIRVPTRLRLATLGVTNV